MLDHEKGAGCSDHTKVLVEKGYLHCLQVRDAFSSMTKIIFSDTTEPELTEMSVDEILNGIPGSNYQVELTMMVMMILNKKGNGW